jgi:hypothetical protein
MPGIAADLSPRSENKIPTFEDSSFGAVLVVAGGPFRSISQDFAKRWRFTYHNILCLLNDLVLFVAMTESTVPRMAAHR